MCEYCKYNKMNREEFKNKLYNCEISPKDLLDVANIGTYINNNELVAIYFDDGIGIEQDSIKIVCCPICKEEFKEEKIQKYKKYDINVVECEKKSSDEIISEFELSEGEIIVMKTLFRKQFDKQDISSELYDDSRIYKLYKTKPEFVKNTFGSLKKKGLIYSVNDMAGWIGTDIRV